MKLRHKLRNWLLKDEFEEYKRLKVDYQSKINSLICEQTKLETKYKQVAELIEVGIDHHVYHEDNNWAVFCIGGKSDYVRFARFEARDVKELQHFIKRYEYSNVRADSCLPKELMFNWENYAVKKGGY